MRPGPGFRLKPSGESVSLFQRMLESGSIKAWDADVHPNGRAVVVKQLWRQQPRSPDLGAIAGLAVVLSPVCPSA